MKKTFHFYAICWIVFLVAFNLIVFLTPNEIAGMSKFSGGFWVGYIFATISLIGQLVCTYFAFQQEKLQKFFYNLSIITISYLASVVSVIVGALCMALPFIPTWIGAVVCVLLLAFNVISVIKATAAADIVSKIDDQIKAQTFFIKSLTVDAESLMAKANNNQTKSELKKVYEAVRYSDPMSHDALSGIEAQITLKFDALSKAVMSGNAEETEAAARELMILINDRNKRCKALK